MSTLFFLCACIFAVLVVLIQCHYVGVVKPFALDGTPTRVAGPGPESALLRERTGGGRVRWMGKGSEIAVLAPEEEKVEEMDMLAPYQSHRLSLSTSKSTSKPQKLPRPFSPLLSKFPHYPSPTSHTPTSHVTSTYKPLLLLTLTIPIAVLDLVLGYAFFVLASLFLETFEHIWDGTRLVKFARRVGVFGKVGGWLQRYFGDSMGEDGWF